MKKLIAIVFSVLMLLSAAACGSDNTQVPDAAPGNIPAADDAGAGETSVGEASVGTGQEYVKPTSGEAELGLYDSAYDYASAPTLRVGFAV